MHKLTYSNPQVFNKPKDLTSEINKFEKNCIYNFIYYNFMNFLKLKFNLCT